MGRSVIRVWILFYEDMNVNDTISVTLPTPLLAKLMK